MSDPNTRVDGLPVAGYRPQNVSAVEMVNRNKFDEERILRVLDALAKNPDVDQRWLAIGRTQIEQGFMAINRAIFRPARVDPLPEDCLRTVVDISGLDPVDVAWIDGTPEGAS